jgi:hypothetical protein
MLKIGNGNASVSGKSDNDSLISISQLLLVTGFRIRFSCRIRLFRNT